MHNVEKIFNILHEKVKWKVLCPDEKPKDEGLKHFHSENDLMDIAIMDFEEIEVDIETNDKENVLSVDRKEFEQHLQKQPGE